MDSVVVTFGVVILLLLSGLGFCIYMCVQQDKEVERCFMQEPRTKECELVLYRYENRTKHTTTVAPMPIIVR